MPDMGSEYEILNGLRGVFADKFGRGLTDVSTVSDELNMESIYVQYDSKLNEHYVILCFEFNHGKYRRYLKFVLEDGSYHIVEPRTKNITFFVETEERPEEELPF